MSEAEMTMDPDSKVTLMVHDARNAGKEPKSRWGTLKFDAKGVAEVSCMVKDIPLLDQLGWLSDEDKAKYLGVAIEAAAEDSMMSAAHAEVERMRAQYDSWAKKMVDDHASDMKAKDDDIASLKKSLEDMTAKLADVGARLNASDKALADATAKLADATAKTDSKKKG